MLQRLCARYEAALRKLAEGLSKPRARGKPEQVHERIGRLKAKHRRVAGYYKLDLTVEGERVASLAFTLHLRKATAVEPHQKPIYDTLGIDPDAGGFVKKSDLNRIKTTGNTQCSALRQKSSP